MMNKQGGMNSMMKGKIWIVASGLLMIALLNISCATGSYQDNGLYHKKMKVLCGIR